MNWALSVFLFTDQKSDARAIRSTVDEPDLEPNLGFSDGETCVINHFHIEFPSLHLRDPEARGQLPVLVLRTGLQGTGALPSVALFSYINFMASKCLQFSFLIVNMFI